ncbi:hypothetical protein OAE37_00005, partial [Pirellulaceae bacterium]|nr:hypothetical protein [Pirellulaceae bacterium]
VRSFKISTKKNNKVFVEPVVDEAAGTYQFKVRMSGEPELLQTVGRRGATCVVSRTPMPLEHVRSEAKANRMSARLLALVVNGPRGRIYLSPTAEFEESADVSIPETIPHAEIDHWAGCTNCVVYGLKNFEDLFSPRQLVALTTFSDLVTEVREKVLEHASDISAGKPLHEGGNGAVAYADAIATYLAIAVDKGADYWATMCTWDNTRESIGHTFGRQAIPMSWDYVEANIFSNSSGNWSGMIKWIEKVLLAIPGSGVGISLQRDATHEIDHPLRPLVSCDPPYYDNVPYSNLSDYFYMWLRRSLHPVFPGLFSTISAPKQPELVANQFRHGGREQAHAFFMDGMELAMSRMTDASDEDCPVTIYYAFKQAETKSSETWSTGWETFLAAVLRAGFSVVGTWPMRTELTNRRLGSGNNVLASSVVLVCRARPNNASMVTRRDFANALRKELPEAINHLQSGNVAPVDLAQASIGPGMAVFSRYSKVVNADGSPMSVREALQLINQVLDESLVEQESDFDAETRFALRWFEQYGMTEGPFGDAETLAKAMAVSVGGVVESGIGHSGAGKFRLLKRSELKPDWDPQTDERLAKWEIAQHLIRTLEMDGETGAGKLLNCVGPSSGEIARELAYRLYQTCEKKKMAEDARAYNTLVVSWPEIVKLSRQVDDNENQEQSELFN